MILKSWLKGLGAVRKEGRGQGAKGQGSRGVQGAGGQGVQGGGGLPESRVEPGGAGERQVHGFWPQFMSLFKSSFFVRTPVRLV